MDYTLFIGYSASAAIMLSFMFKNVKKLRLVNSVGCILFILYGYLLDWNWPLIIPNTFVLALNIYHLSKRVELEDDEVASAS